MNETNRVYVVTLVEDGEVTQCRVFANAGSAYDYGNMLERLKSQDDEVKLTVCEIEGDA